MKKAKKGLIYSGIALTLFLFICTAASAYSFTFTRYVPAVQGWDWFVATTKTYSTDRGTIELTRKDADKVSFYLHQIYLDGTYSTLTTPGTVTKTNTLYDVFYLQTVSAGAKVIGKYRNANWTLNSDNVIQGTFDYK